MKFWLPPRASAFPSRKWSRKNAPRVSGAQPSNASCARTAASRSDASSAARRRFARAASARRGGGGARQTPRGSAIPAATCAETNPRVGVSPEFRQNFDKRYCSLKAPCSLVTAPGRDREARVSAPEDAAVDEELGDAAVHGQPRDVPPQRRQAPGRRGRARRAAAARARVVRVVRVVRVAGVDVSVNVVVGAGVVARRGILLAEQRRDNGAAAREELVVRAVRVLVVVVAVAVRRLVVRGRVVVVVVVARDAADGSEVLERRVHGGRRGRLRRRGQEVAGLAKIQRQNLQREVLQRRPEHLGRGVRRENRVPALRPEAPADAGADAACAGGNRASGSGPDRERRGAVSKARV